MTLERYMRAQLPPCPACHGYGTADGLPAGTYARDFGAADPGPCDVCDGTGDLGGALPEGWERRDDGAVRASGWRVRIVGRVVEVRRHDELVASCVSLDAGITLVELLDPATRQLEVA